MWLSYIAHFLPCKSLSTFQGSKDIHSYWTCTPDWSWGVIYLWIVLALPLQIHGGKRISKQQTEGKIIAYKRQGVLLKTWPVMCNSQWRHRPMGLGSFSGSGCSQDKNPLKKVLSADFVNEKGNKLQKYIWKHKFKTLT